MKQMLKLLWYNLIAHHFVKVRTYDVYYGGTERFITKQINGQDIIQSNDSYMISIKKIDNNVYTYNRSINTVSGWANIGIAKGNIDALKREIYFGTMRKV